LFVSTQFTSFIAENFSQFPAAGFSISTSIVVLGKIFGDGIF
jgi:hypothetical protein